MSTFSTTTRPDPLLFTPVEVAVHTGDPDWVVVDCRFILTKPDAGEAAYRAGHIPGAYYADLDRDLAAPRTPESGRHPLPAVDQLVRLFSRWGVTPATQVVAYDDAGGAIAARLWWLLRWLGHQRVGLLDGGLPAWSAAGLPLEAAVPAARNRPFNGRPGQMPAVDTAGVERAIAARNILLLDARGGERFRGEVEPIDPVAGHVPGAINAPFQDSLAPGGAFRSANELKERFESLLADRRGEEAVFMCGSGVTACHGIFALELAGLGCAGLYPGSWSEWIRSPGRPVARD